ncbi:MAG: DinB family protein [Paracoccaceae bacterium]|nr:DinB family protein [Paracoccaceae bacterium]
MARYNAWQNRSVYAAADGLGDADRRADRGAFWGSIHRTLSHLLWGDTIWMGRFDGGPPPDVKIADSGDWVVEWEELKLLREGLDGRIFKWALAAKPADIEGDLVWFSGAVGREVRQPKAVCLIQLFNHQTHHRGQVHAMLTAAGARPEDTDLPFMPADA